MNRPWRNMEDEETQKEEGRKAGRKEDRKTGGVRKDWDV